MYLDHFSLRQYPFQLVPDPEFLFMGPQHSHAKAYLDYAVYNRDGFVVVTGDVGTGKTTLLHKFLTELDANVLAAKIFQTQLTATEFLQAVLVEFGLNPFQAQKVELMDMLNTFLVDRFLEGRQIVLIVDEAQNLSDEALEEIRLLSGLETHKEKILHVILLGQPQLRDRLDNPHMEQFAQRVRLRYHIRALTETETGGYIHHRLEVAGAGSNDLFEAQVFPEIFRYTGGVPRLINVLCDTALVCGFADAHASVSPAVMDTAIKELGWVPFAERQKAHVKVSNPVPSAGASAAGAGVNLGNAQADALIFALNGVVGRLGEIESSLKGIADRINRNEPVVPFNRKSQ
jgi:type II secretory pathway predicted ATPase ExeA